MARRTEQREAIHRVFQTAQGPLSPKEILEGAQKVVPGMGIATVYRNLRTLIEEGGIKPVSLPGEPDRYARSDRGAHHYFRCRCCERVFDVPRAAVEGTLPSGFQIERAQVVFDGVCTQCNAPAVETAPPAQPVEPAQEPRVAQPAAQPEVRPAVRQPTPLPMAPAFHSTP